MSNLLNPKRKPNSQNTLILKYLEDGYSLTPMEGLDLFKTMNLAQRISQLRQDGHIIRDRWVESPNGKKFKEYFMEF